MEEPQHDKLQCQECRKEIQFGKEFTTTEKSVVGPRGVVPLGHVIVLCSNECVAKYFADQNGGEVSDVNFRQPY